MTHTEIATIPLQAGVDLSDQNSEPSKILTENLSTVLAQPGIQRLWWATDIEDSSMLRVFIDWDNVEAHKKFMASADYGPFMSRFKSLLGGEPLIYHIALNKPNATNAIGLGVTSEVFVLDFPADSSESTRSEMSSKVSEFLSGMEKEAGGPKGWTFGFSLENDLPAAGNKDLKGYKFTAILGWNSVDEHMAFRNTPWFQEHSIALRQLPGAQGMNMYHIKGQPEQARGI